MVEYQLRQLPWQPRHFQQYRSPAQCARVTVEYLCQLGLTRIHIVRYLAI